MNLAKFKIILKRLAIIDRNLGFFDFGECDVTGKSAEICRAPKKTNGPKAFEHNHNRIRFELVTDPCRYQL